MFRKIYITVENSQGGNFGSSDTEHGAVRGIMYQEEEGDITEKVNSYIFKNHLDLHKTVPQSTNR